MDVGDEVGDAAEDPSSEVAFVEVADQRSTWLSQLDEVRVKSRWNRW